MTDDATLSDFDTSAGDADSTTTESPRADAAPSETDDGTVDTGASADGPGEKRSETVFSTYAWGTYTCSQCGDETDSVWRSDGELVCPECKEW
ncbi:hypothetical protein HYG81_09355 [Natrinema zhouii]|uniref:DUF7573 domain-containing protein n=1 Tax=Natrinema zhouii TaxID=1710539 RepID=A0A7D6GIJ1_9EURY|nr:hypothetical protein [Natrinema zhouii]QLK24340.1 hypothetical protein HYG81_09355 [Natrinema zhouii]